MKKFLLPILLFLMFIPLYVNAETCDTDKITIENITIESKSDNVEELSEATANGKNINLNLSMSEVGDNIEYKFVVKNDSNEDYEIDKTSLNLNSDYINYSFETEDNTNIVKANTSKNVTLRVEYKNEVPEDKFKSGSYNDSKTMIVQLSNGNTINVPDTFKNPNTGVQSYILIILILLLISGSLYVLIKKKKYTKFMILVIGTAIIIPIGVYALCKCDILIFSKIRISDISCSFANDTWEEISNNIRNNNLDCYNVGDTKEVNMEDFGNHTVRIANLSTPIECSTEEFSQTACGFVLEFSDIITTHRMNPYWAGASIGDGNNGGWEHSEMRTYLSSDIFDALPIELKDIIIDTKVVSGHGLSDSENFITTDKIYLLSTHEVWEDDTPGNYGIKVNDTAYYNTRQLDYYLGMNVTTTNVSGAIKKYNELDNNWWLRSPGASSRPSFLFVVDSGHWSGVSSNGDFGVSPAFRIG